MLSYHSSSECSGDLVYKSCGTACPNVCGEEPVEVCIQVCVAGCQCPDDLWLSGDDTCVRQEQCNHSLQILS